MELSIIRCLGKVRSIWVEYRLSYLGHELLKQTTAINSIFYLVILVYELNLETSLPINSLCIGSKERVFQDVVTTCLDVDVHSIVITVVDFGLQLVYEEEEDFCSHHELVDLRGVDDTGHAHALSDLSKCKVFTLIL